MNFSTITEKLSEMRFLVRTDLKMIYNGINDINAFTVPVSVRDQTLSF